MENGIILDGKTQGLDVSLEVASGTQLHTARGHHIALYLSQNQNVSGGKICGNFCVGTNGEAVIAEIDGPFHSPIYDEVLFAFDFTADHDRLANPRG